MPRASFVLFFASALTLASTFPAHSHLAGFDQNPHPFEQSSDYTLDVVEPGKHHIFPPPAKSLAAISPAARQPVGALTGRIVFMTAGHGWMYDPDFSPPWRVMRPSPLNEMNEDYGNVDQLNFFATYCFNAGATVVAFRPIGNQTNEVVLNNMSPNVSWAGSWSDSSDSVYFGAAGDAVRYRFATLNASETATATYAPNIPKAGYYPVYTWVRHGSNRADQLYRIRHTGGESQITVPHYMVGNGWVYLGEYYFNAGSNSLNGAVIISNQRNTAQGSVVIADAIRFGNGMGSIVRGGGVSDYPREDECARYWVQAGIGQGQSSTLYDGGSGTDDESDAWHTPPRMSAEMNNNSVVTNIFRRIHINFHSNAANTSARGTTALVNNSTSIRTPNQLRLAQIVADTIDNDLIALGSPPLEAAWGARGTAYTSQNYTEISNTYLNNEMDATMVEVAFHDNVTDARLMRDPKGRAAVARATLHSVIKFFNEFDGLPIAYFPESPTNVRAIGGTNGRITLSWSAPGTGAANGYSQSATNYVIYRSTNGFGFGNPISVGNVLTYAITDLAPNVDYYFQIAAANAGGESMPSEVVGCRAALTNGPKVLYVNAFDRFDRTTNLRQDTARQNWDPPGPSGGIERVWPRAINAFNYVVPHGKAMAAYGMAFDTCQNEAVANNNVPLGNYPIVIWAAGQEATSNETFSATEQTRVSTFLNAGGHLFVSGSEIGWDLDRASGPTSGDRAFYNNYLHADFNNDTNDDSNVYSVAAVAGSIFAGRSNAAFDNGNNGIYWVQFPDILTPFGAGVKPALYYNNSTNVAALQYTPGGSGGRVVYFGFPFETITTAARQANYMQDILDFFTPAKIVTPPFAQNVNASSDVTFSVVAEGHEALSYQWLFNGTNLAGAVTSSLTLTNVQLSHAGDYSVLVTNSDGAALSSPVSLTVNVPPSITQHPQSQTVLISNAVTFNVIADGMPLPNYQWLFNGTNLAGATGSSLAILSAQLTDAGDYSVIVSNLVDSVTSSNATLTVNVPLMLSSAPTISSNHILLSVSGNNGSNYMIQSSTNLVDWSEVTTFPLTNGTFQFSDFLTNEQKFYRVLKP